MSCNRLLSVAIKRLASISNLVFHGDSAHCRGGKNLASVVDVLHGVFGRVATRSRRRRPGLDLVHLSLFLARFKHNKRV